MSEPEDKGVVEAAAEKPRELAEEAARGRSERTPLIALTGVTIAVGVVVGIVLALAFFVYWLA